MERTPNDDLEPITPVDALELYFRERSHELRETTVRAHKH